MLLPSKAQSPLLIDTATYKRMYPPCSTVAHRDLMFHFTLLNGGFTVSNMLLFQHGGTAMFPICCYRLMLGFQYAVTPWARVDCLHIAYTSLERWVLFCCVRYNYLLTQFADSKVIYCFLEWGRCFAVFF